MAGYQTVKSKSSDQLVEQRSRFIGYCTPVQTEQEAIDFIAEIKQKHWDARHNVYAYLLKDGTARYSDDGEPQSTAGLPILEVLKSIGVYNTCVVVTRYFGGILLGTGGLVRAYSQSAKLAIEAAGIVQMVPGFTCHLTCQYPQYAKLHSCLLSHGCVVTDSIFEQDVFLQMNIPETALDSVKEAITQLSAGTVELVIGQPCEMETAG